MNNSDILWQPTPEQAQSSQMQRFTDFVNQRHGLQLRDYSELHSWSVADSEAFWVAIWDFCEVVGIRGERVVENREQLEKACWFPEAQFNFAQNLLRRSDNSPALLFRMEDQPETELSWAELQAQVSQFAQYLKQQGIEPGDRVAAITANCPETVVAMLAVTSLGGVWTSTSPDFGSSSILERFGQVEPKLLIAVDGYQYAGKQLDIRDKVLEVADSIASVQQVVLIPLLGLDVLPEQQWQTALASHQPGPIEYHPSSFNDPLYILYSSGTTGKPKCIVHKVGGTLLQHLKEHRLHSDIRPNDRVFYFTTCGWMMWNWLASALASKATLMLYEGSPFHPHDNVLWEYADSAQCSLFGTSAKYLDALSKHGYAPQEHHDLTALRTLCSTGSVLAPESFDFVYQSIKSDLCLASICGGTDIVSCFILGNPTLPVRRGECQCVGLGMDVQVFDDDGAAIVDEKGELVCLNSFPNQPLQFWDDADGSKYHNAYFSRFDNSWCQGDYVLKRPHGGVVVFGRSDATLNPGGVRIGTAEIYRHVEQLDEVIESVAVGQDWQGDVRVVLFVVLREGMTLDAPLTDRIRQTIRQHCTPRHVPAKVLQVAEIPRTRSGKLVELAIRETIHERAVKNLNALANPETLAHFANREELQS